MSRMRQAVRRHDVRWWVGRMLGLLDRERPPIPRQREVAVEPI